MLVVELDDCMQKSVSRSIFITLKTHPQVNKRTQHDTGTLTLTEQKVRNNLELIGTGKYFLKTPLLAQVLRTTIIK